MTLDMNERYFRQHHANVDQSRIFVVTVIQVLVLNKYIHIIIFIFIYLMVDCIRQTLAFHLACRQDNADLFETIISPYYSMVFRITMTLFNVYYPTEGIPNIKSHFKSAQRSKSQLLYKNPKCKCFIQTCLPFVWKVYTLNIWRTCSFPLSVYRYYA